MGIHRRTAGSLLAGLAAASLLVGALPARQGGGGIFLPGTQPNAVAVTPPFICSVCHGSYSTGTVEPFDTWAGTMHANAGRDPVFRAALAVANQDVPGSGEWCLRCHTPKGWLEGRSTPSDGSALLPDDLESVQCDVCHRMVDPLTSEGQGLVNPDVNGFGNGMFVVDPGNPPAEPPKRGPYSNSVSPFHPTIDSPFHRTGNLCGTCHDVSNPLQANPSDPYNPQLAHAIERTYSEWKASDYFGLGEAGNCQSCHMKHLATDYACALTTFANPRPFLPTHDFTGGNAWVPQIIPGYWSLGPYFYNIAAGRAVQTLQGAARLWVTTRTVGGQVEARVRVKNLTGHKLPTGYPEGRRMWVQVRGLDSTGSLVFESGAYDATTAILVPDAQLKVYEARQGQSGPGGCTPGFHFVLNNCIAKDNRVPPKGFTNA
ncbi:MAG TPA: multiheme c-type cytochrome, partial [Planctomycetota bacterium]|nr:multiheme c-type cytochrome [Planctomycetota bacterium]